MKKLNREDFDFYYLIICSRGPGSETITVTNVTVQRENIHFMEEAEAEFKLYGACEAEAHFNDEGPIIAVPTGTKPLKSIYEWLKKDAQKIAEEHGLMSSHVLPLLQDIEKKMVEKGTDSSEVEKAREAAMQYAENPLLDFNYNQAYLSASLRAFLPNEIGEDGNPWTSVNGWRKVEIEIPNKAQFEKLMEATCETAEQLGQWDCAVLKGAAERYLEGKLPEPEFPGC